MEHELWPVWSHNVREVARAFQQQYVQIPGGILVRTMLWAARHDRPVQWACGAEHWKTTRLRPPRLPSPRTMSRRVDGVAWGWLWRGIEQRLRAVSAAHPGVIAFLDGKPLPGGARPRIPTPVRGGRPASWPKAISCIRFGPIAPCRRGGRGRR
jgi:hypothetical protein